MSQPDFSPAADRNKDAILSRLQQLLPASGTALEIASGSGQHAAWFASRLPGWQWQTSDAHSAGFGSIQAWAAQQGATGVRAPIVLDVTADPWLPEGTRFDLIYCANMLHIAPWAATAGLMRGSARHLAPGGVLLTYGPYLEDDVPTAPGNASFDASLRAENAAWGIRQRKDVEGEAAQAGLELHARHAMPANNLLLVWKHAA